MPKSTIHPPGEKIQKAVKALSDLIEAKPEKTRNQLLQEICLKFDLSPAESTFLERHFSEKS